MNNNRFKDFCDQCCKVWSQKSPQISQARQYLEDRGFPLPFVIEQGIGYCPDASMIPDNIRFIGSGDHRKDYHYRIQERIIVPVADEFGDVVLFSTRKPVQGETWWNYPISKSNYLFLLNKARSHIFRQNMVIIVEGYMDALQLYLHGVKNVCAVMGTALTSRQIGLIARYCNRVCLLFDCDENQSGQKAMKRSAIALHKYHFCENIYKIVLPIKEDPDSFVKKYGVERLLEKQRIITTKQIIKMERDLKFNNVSSQ